MYAIRSYYETSISEKDLLKLSKNENCLKDFDKYNSLTLSDNAETSEKMRKQISIIVDYGYGTSNRITSYNVCYTKLLRLTTSLLRPVDKSDDEDTLNKRIAELNAIKGVGAAIYKVNETTYEIVQTCNILNMDATDIEKGCLISYFDSKEIPNLTKDDILDNYSKAMTCQ